MYSSATIDSISSSNAPSIRRPQYSAKDITSPSSSLLKLIANLKLEKHPEGGYFRETDRSPFLMENPYYPGHSNGTGTKHLRAGNSNEPPVTVQDPDTGENRKLSANRNFSTLIHYLITCDAPMGRFHVNRSRITHILQRGRGQYVLVYPDGTVKTFIVGFNTERGEVDQWVVPGGVYKASFLLPLDETKGESDEDHLLISEIVVPGFDFEDHKFMPSDRVLEGLVG
ncbi:DEKNAAC103749, partial [Brettanomyces naardenensis]